MSEKENKVICKACGKEFKTERQLHAHIKVHNLRVVEYNPEICFLVSSFK